MAKTYIERRATGWRFVMRLHPDKGTFYGLEQPTKFTRQLSASTEAQALVQAEEIATKLKTLQRVSKADRSSSTASTRDVQTAVDAFLFFHDFDVRTHIQSRDSRSLTTSIKHDLAQAGFVDQVDDFYCVNVGVKHRRYTQLGAAILDVLSSNKRPQLTLSEVLPIYLSSNRTQPFSVKAKHDSNRYVTLFESITSKRPFDLINREDVNIYKSIRLQSVGASSVRREIRSLSAIWNFTCNEAFLDLKNPFSKISLPVYAKKSRATAMQEDVKRLYKLLISSERNSHIEPLCLIVLLTGCRLGEAWGLETTDLNSDRKVFLIRPNSTRRIKNSISQRELPLTNTLERSISKYLGTSRPKSANSASAAICAYLKSHGFNFSSHSLRHHLKDQLTELRALDYEINAICGWSNRAMRDAYGNRELQRPIMKLLLNYEKLLAKI